MERDRTAADLSVSGTSSASAKWSMFQKNALFKPITLDRSFLDNPTTPGDNATSAAGRSRRSRIEPTQ
jgi:hypothetical protein